jgi:hypothetical protein
VARVMRELGAEELRTDEHSGYQGASGDRPHRLCLAHWRKSKRAWVLLRRAQAEQRPLEVQTLQQLQALLRLVGRYIHARKGLPWRINQLLQHIERIWAEVSDDPVDPTNNVTERIIGQTYKILTKTMRGMKSQAKS